MSLQYKVDSNNKQIYPIDTESGSEYVLNDTYALDESGKPYYPTFWKYKLVLCRNEYRAVFILNSNIDFVNFEQMKTVQGVNYYLAESDTLGSLYWRVMIFHKDKFSLFSKIYRDHWKYQLSYEPFSLVREYKSFKTTPPSNFYLYNHLDDDIDRTIKVCSRSDGKQFIFVKDQETPVHFDSNDVLHRQYTNTYAGMEAEDIYFEPYREDQIIIYTLDDVHKSYLFSHQWRILGDELNGELLRYPRNEALPSNFPLKFAQDLDLDRRIFCYALNDDGEWLYNFKVYLDAGDYSILKFDFDYLWMNKYFYREDATDAKMYFINEKDIEKYILLYHQYGFGDNYVPSKELLNIHPDVTYQTDSTGKQLYPTVEKHEYCHKLLGYALDSNGEQYYPKLADGRPLILKNIDTEEPIFIHPDDENQFDVSEEFEIRIMEFFIGNDVNVKMERPIISHQYYQHYQYATPTIDTIKKKNDAIFSNLFICIIIFVICIWFLIYIIAK